jgi:hypothetical protein
MQDSYGDFWEPVGRVRQADRDFPRRPYSSDERERTAAGSVLLGFISSLAAILVIAGLIYATGASARHKAALLQAGCEPSLFILGLPCTTVWMVHRQYKAIVNPAIRQLNADAAAYHANEGNDLVAAEAALTSEVATEQALDKSLAAVMFTPKNRATANTLITYATSFGNPLPMAAVTFTPQMTVVADALVRDILALATLTAKQARSSSLTELRSFNSRVMVATAAAQTELKLLRTAVYQPLPRPSCHAIIC